MLHELSMDGLCHAKPQNPVELLYSHCSMSWPRIATMSLGHQIWLTVLDPKAFCSYPSASPKQNVMTQPCGCSAHPFSQHQKALQQDWASFICTREKGSGCMLWLTAWNHSCMGNWKSVVNFKHKRCSMKRWLGYENIPSPSKTGVCATWMQQTVTAEWFDQVAGTGFKKSVQQIVFSLYVFSQIIILENTNLRVTVCAVAN